MTEETTKFQLLGIRRNISICSSEGRMTR